MRSADCGARCPIISPHPPNKDPAASAPCSCVPAMAEDNGSPSPDPPHTLCGVVLRPRRKLGLLHVCAQEAISTEHAKKMAPVQSQSTHAQCACPNMVCKPLARSSILSRPTFASAMRLHMQCEAQRSGLGQCMRSSSNVQHSDTAELI